MPTPFRVALLAASFCALVPIAPSLAQSAPAAARSVERAIARVYPALVQIRVLVADHSSGRARKFEASGSGVIISPDGYVVTNHHVAGRAVSVRVTLSTKEEMEAELVGTDALSDIAVLKLDLSQRRKNAPPLPSAMWGASDALKVGDTVLAMGCPLALSQSVTEGIVANKDMMLPRPLEGRFLLDGEDVGSLVKWIGHDAAIQPGNSGGPLVDLDGEVVGINELGLGSMSGAIPSELAKAVSAELIAHGKVKRAWIGADFQARLKDHDPAAPESKGVLVAGVLRGSPAESAGLRAGDRVTAVDGAKVDTGFREELPAFNLLLFSKAPGTPIVLTVMRDKKELSIKVPTELRDEAEGKPVETKEWGLVIEPITKALEEEMQRPDMRGVLVHGVRSGGPADQGSPSLQPRDVILEVGGNKVQDVDAFLALTKAIPKAGAPVPTVVLFERRAEKLLTLIEVGIRTPQEPADEVHKAWLPVATQVLSKKLSSALGLKGRTGVRITQVFPQSSAESAGFQVGDVVTQIDGVQIEASEAQDANVFDGMIRAYRLGSKADFTVLRDGKPLTLTATLDEGPKPDREMRIYEDAQLEFRARDVSVFDRVRSRWAQNQGGALITQVESGGWAAVGGLHQDDLVLAVDGEPIAQVDALETTLKAAHTRKDKQIGLLLRRGVHTLFVELEPKWQ